jgi:hypothetical protein
VLGRVIERIAQRDPLDDEARRLAQHFDVAGRAGAEGAIEILHELVGERVGQKGGRVDHRIPRKQERTPDRL